MGIWMPPPDDGSGKLGMPLARMQSENLRPALTFARLDEPLDLLEPQAATATQISPAEARTRIRRSRMLVV